jgi:poly(A) polymerase
MREIWLMQPRFERRTARSAMALVMQNRFRAGFDFLRLRAQCGEVSLELAEWWEAFSLADEHSRASMIDVVMRERRLLPGRKGKRDDDGDDDAEVAVSADVSPARKRRRRRRKPRAGDGASAPTED